MQLSFMITSVLLGLAAAAENYDVGVCTTVIQTDAAPSTLAFSNILPIGLQRGILRGEFSQHQMYLWIRELLNPTYALVDGL